MLNIVRRVEESEDKGEYEITCISWYVYIMNIYLIVLFQTMCKWIMGIMDEGVELPRGNIISFHLLKESIEKKVVLKGNMTVQVRTENS